MYVKEDSKEVIIDSTMTAKDFLMGYTRGTVLLCLPPLLISLIGAYTCCRTVNQSSILLLDRHIDRLVESMELLGMCTMVDREDMKGRVLYLLSLLRPHWSLSPSTEHFICIACTPTEGNNYSLGIHISPLSYTTTLEDTITSTSIVCYVTEGRRTPLAKSIWWITERKQLEDVKASAVSAIKDKLHGEVGYMELIMITKEGGMLEGLVSNILAVRDGVLITAPLRTVLEGHIAEVVMEVCRDVLGMGVERISPSIHEVSSYDSIFISNAGKIISRVDKVYIVETDGEVRLLRDFGEEEDPWFRKIKIEILKALPSLSQPF